MFHRKNVTLIKLRLDCVEKAEAPQETVMERYVPSFSSRYPARAVKNSPSLNFAPINPPSPDPVPTPNPNPTPVPTPVPVPVPVPAPNSNTGASAAN